MPKTIVDEKLMTDLALKFGEVTAGSSQVWVARACGADVADVNRVLNLKGVNRVGVHRIIGWLDKLGYAVTLKVAPK